DFVQFRGGRSHSAGNREQRVSSVRQESWDERAVLPSNFVGLEAVDADGLSRGRARFIPRTADQQGGRMSSGVEAPMIELTNVGKRYGNANNAVLDSVDLYVLKGEFVTLIGPSGCGKSTVLRLISGLTPPTAGTLRVDGMTPVNAREVISYIFQDATLLPWRTVRQNVGLGLELEGVSRERRAEKIASLLELVGLSHVADAYPRQ